MKRLTEAWFEFKGVKSSDMGVLLRQMPTRFLPGRSFTRKKAAGRDGSILTGDGSYNDVSVRIECSVPDASKLAAVLAWLTGSGSLRFSDEPDLTYDASVEKEYSRASILSRCEGQRFTVTWTCAPIRRLYPDAADITVKSSGTAFTAQGTYFALPRLAIYGSGAFHVTISGGGHSSTDALYAAFAELVALKAGTITADNIQTDALAAELARITVLACGSASFDRATVTHLVSEALNLEYGVAGQVFIRNLAVEYAQMIGATIGNLCIRASDGNYYSIDVDESGNVSATRTTVSSGEISAGQTSGGRVILETNIAAANLSTSNLLATYALVNRIDAARIDVAELFPYFNPRSPCGERLLPQSMASSNKSISIHAPRAESDGIAHKEVMTWTYFNPRSPCGERPTRRAAPMRQSDFNPRSPCGERPERD